MNRGTHTWVSFCDIIAAGLLLNQWHMFFNVGGENTAGLGSCYIDENLFLLSGNCGRLALKMKTI